MACYLQDYPKISSCIFNYLKNKRKFIVDVNLEENSFSSQNNTSNGRTSGISESERRNLPNNTRRNNNNKKENKDEEEKKEEEFEAPEFLYKYSSTFFKKASEKEKKINKIFNQIDGNKEAVHIRSVRNSERNDEISFKIEESFESNKSMKSFKKFDLKLENVKINKDDLQKNHTNHNR